MRADAGSRTCWLVPPAVGGHAEAVVREAVSNAVRHGRASSVTVTVEAGADLVIEVVDDGLGIPDGVARSGLRDLEGRAAECGGELLVGVGPGAAPGCGGGPGTAPSRATG